MFSERGKKFEIIDNYKLRFHKVLSNNVSRWCCGKKTCSAYFKKSDDGEIMERNLVHNHEPETERSLERQKLRNTVKRKAIDDLCERPAKLIHQEIKNIGSNTDIIDAEDYLCVAKGVYNARRTILPRKPKSREETHDFLRGCRQSSETEIAVLENSAEKGVVVFSCTRNLIALCDSDALYVDGTFKCSPKFFTQLFTVHGMLNGYYVPLVFALVHSKESSAYAHVFNVIVRECRKFNKVCAPKIVYADFEDAIHIAVREVWPNADVRGCRFHLGQSWWRRMQAIGLAPAYEERNDCNERTELGKFLVHLFGLPLLQPNMVEDCFVFDIMTDAPRNDKVTKLMDYMTDNYISPGAKYPPEMWACMTSSQARTTNACESFHAKFNSRFYVPHPNIFIFLEVIGEIQANTLLRLNSAKRKIKQPRSNVRQKIDFLEKQIHNVTTGVLTPYDYVKKVSYRNTPVLKM